SLKSTTAKVPASRAPTFTVNCNPVLFATRPLLLPSPLPWLPHASGFPGAARRYPD
ncbi:hypothetical protein H4F45_20095, partial [Pectobacterium brasiliense]|nr:hypothetical protein [Pectobacterium brasiliense]